MGRRAMKLCEDFQRLACYRWASHLQLQVAA